MHHVASFYKFDSSRNARNAQALFSEHDFHLQCSSHYVAIDSPLKPRLRIGAQRRRDSSLPISTPDHPKGYQYDVVPEQAERRLRHG